MKVDPLRIEKILMAFKEVLYTLGSEDFFFAIHEYGSAQVLRGNDGGYWIVFQGGPWLHIFQLKGKVFVSEFSMGDMKIHRQILHQGSGIEIFQMLECQPAMAS